MDGPQNQPTPNVNLKIATINIENVKSNAVYLEHLAETCNIICIQEHWLHRFEEGALKDLLPSFSYALKCHDDNNPIAPSHRPRGTAGVAILWNKDLDHTVTPLPDGGSRTILIEIATNKQPIILINTYMPTQGSHDKSTDYNMVLDEIHEITEKYNKDHLLIWAGDLNASLKRQKPTTNDAALKKFCLNYGYRYPAGTPDTATYYHFAHNITSQIDYFMQLRHQSQIISEIQVDTRNPINTSSHDAVIASVVPHLHAEKKTTSKGTMYVLAKPNWEKVDLQRYKELTDAALQCLASSYLDNIHPPFLIDRINAILTSAAASAGAHTKKVKRRHTKSPWHETLKPLVKISKQLHYQHSQNPSTENHKKLKAAKKSLRAAQRQMSANKRRKLHADIMNAEQWDKKLYYKLVQKQRKAREMGSTVDFGHKSQDQAEGWAEYFSDLATPLQMDHFNESYKTSVEFRALLLQDLQHQENTPLEISNTATGKFIASLKDRKAADIYGLTAEHLKHASPQITDVLTHLLTEIVKRGELPSQLKLGLITPVHKKGKCPKNPDHYRRITVNSMIGKVLEKYILAPTRDILNPQQSALQF
jgi:hypothetical protein